jgi:hypothetical protein
MKNNLLKRVLKSTAAKLIAAFLMLSSGQSNAATSTNTNTALPWNTSSSGWTGVAGDAWDSTNGKTNTAVFTNALGSITVTNSGIWFNGITYSPAAASSFTISGGTLNLSGSIPTINVSTTGSAVTISAIIEGSAGLVKSGSGTLTLTGVNTRSGMLTINAGTVNVTGATAQLGARTASVTLADVAGATLDFTGVTGSRIIGSLSGGGANGGNIVNKAGIYFGDGASGNFTYGGIISGAGFMSYGGTAGTQTLSGMNTYSGSTSITKGTLSINSISSVGGGASSLGSVTSVTGGTISIGSTTTTGTLLYTGTGHSTDRVVNLAGSTGGATLNASGSGALVFSNAFTATGVGAKTLTLTGTNTADNRIGGAIVNSSSGATSLTKSGAGNWILSGANTYTGGTTVSAGTLLVNTGASIASSASIVNGGLLTVKGTAGSVTVNSGGSLGGSGTVGALTLNSGGLLNPGNSPGILTASSTIILGGATYNWQISALQGTAGTNWDLLSVTGLLDMTGVTSLSKWNLVVTGDSGFAGWTDTSSHSYVFAQAANLSLSSGFSSAVGTDVTSLFNITALNITSLPNATHNPNGDFKVVVGSASGLATLNLMTIPESSSGSLMAFAAISLMALRAMRKK